MTISPADLALYVGALLVLFFTPGPVWVALIARGVSGGFAAAWPLALGVVIGDALWPFLAILGVSWVISAFDGVMLAMRFVAAAFFFWMGWALLRKGGTVMSAGDRLTRPGAWAGFTAGVAVILGNPKAILFYMGVLPGFFDLSAIAWPDIMAIVLASMLVPFLGNLALAAFLGRARALISSPRAVRRMNRAAGLVLIAVGAVIPFA